jgi:hypothetical protein
MKPESPTPRVPKPVAPTQNPQAASTEAKLREALRMRSLMGDPRVRVEVPTAKSDSKQCTVSSEKRYHIG